ncbi:MAG: tRNA (adenosine(37)-N6)-threonylcarbamoyltransferase complex dimerization subunit type 1 TsaB [Bacteroidetes bacterium]|nr:tRNA (adenosine(37)-N6)-threonylcarbamoyltransferase complex dimerization subunit type 1 TsaB [Bacteroidota bacterium]
MTTILLVETTTETCSVGLAVGGQLISLREVRDQKSHASRLAVFIKEVLAEAGVVPRMLSAVAVSSGPGSYTGLRIGVSAAKGLCYALDIPLIAVDTLQSMATAFAYTYRQNIGPGDILIPMTDARRMEVYAALFDSTGKRMTETTAKVLNANSFDDQSNRIIWLFGDGAAKTQELFRDHNFIHIQPNFLPSAAHLAVPADFAFSNNQFTDLAYFEPFYLKDFVAGIPKVKGLK